MTVATTVRLLGRLKIGTPIFQAPMAGVSSPAMAAAVSTAPPALWVGQGAPLARCMSAGALTRALADEVRRL